MKISQLCGKLPFFSQNSKFDFSRLISKPKFCHFHVLKIPILTKNHDFGTLLASKHVIHIFRDACAQVHATPRNPIQHGPFNSGRSKLPSFQRKQRSVRIVCWPPRRRRAGHKFSNFYPKNHDFLDLSIYIRVKSGKVTILRRSY